MSLSSRHTIKVTFLDVGQGDTIVISSEATKEAIVVDCADAQMVTDYLVALGTKHLRGVIITHLHTDHYRGVPELLNNCLRFIGTECELLLYNQLTVQGRKKKAALFDDSDGHSTSERDPDAIVRARTNALRNLRSWGDEHLAACGPITLGAYKLSANGELWKQIELIHPYHVHLDELESSGLNDTSVVLKVHGPGSSALLTGDLEVDGFRKIQANGVSLKSEVLKMPHHGGWNADPALILDAVNPSIVAISVGSDGQRYNHPNSTTFDRIREHVDTRLLCTQGTARCGPGNRDAAIARLQAKPDSPPIATAGQPCAGSVVVELGNTARVLWPERDVHLGLIQAHFPQHQCTLAK